MEPAETILIIDDDSLLREILREILEEMGLAVAEAAGGAEGLAAVVRLRPALVLLDLSMPGMSGFEVCERIRALPEAEATPVIVITGLEGTAQRVQAFRNGAVDYLTKPLMLEDVAMRVRTHLGLRRQKVDLRESRDQLRKALHDAAAMNRNLVALNEKLRVSEAAKTRFLAHMRNEINNPLSDIMGLASEIADPALPPERGRELAALIKEEAFQLDRQIHNVFSAAELEAGEANPFFARVDVASVLRDTLVSFAASAGAKGLELAYLPREEPCSFPTDGEKLHHIVSNLLANAVQGAAPGSKVELRTACGDRLEVTVADQGPGIPEAELRAIFDPFHMQDGPHTHRGQTLGLPVVKALVDLLEGDLKVESAPGRGSVFRVSLPRAPGGDAEGMDGNMLIFDEPQEF